MLFFNFIPLHGLKWFNTLLFFKEAEAVIEARLTNKPMSTELLKKEEKHHVIQQSSTGVSFVLITTLLIIPIVVLLAIAVFIRWRKSRVYGGM